MCLTIVILVMMGMIMTIVMIMMMAKIMTMVVIKMITGAMCLKMIMIRGTVIILILLVMIITNQTHLSLDGVPGDLQLLLLGKYDHLRHCLIPFFAS